MQNTDYRQSLENAVRALHQAEMELFTAMVNVGFKGPYEDISRVHEVGEVLNLELAMFEGTEDANLEALVEAVKHVARTKQALMNRNALDIELEGQ
jgi:hypothetical protein